MKYKKIDISKRWEVSEDAAKEFIDHRANLKKPLTQRAFERAMATASDGPSRLGMPVDWVIEKTIDQGWQGVNLDWLVSHTGVSGGREFESRFLQVGDRSTRSLTLDDELSTDWAK